MKHHLSFLTGFVLLLLSFPACTSDFKSQTENLAFSITGNLQTGFHLSQKTSRNPAEDLEWFAPGSQISFYSRGGIEADNLTLTFNGTSWTGLPNEEWIPGEKQAHITAYYPPLASGLYTSDGKLTDFLFLKQDFSQSNHIRLTFSHLFSQVSFHLPGELNKQVAEVRFTPSTTIAGIDPYSATIEYGTRTTTHRFLQEEDLTYTFIIPPSDAMSIDIEIICLNEKSYHAQLPESRFQSGVRYECNLLYDSGTPSIKTAEDFIAFAHLINGKTYGSRKLEEFGSSVNGTTVYQLKNNICFTEEESNKLPPVGVPLGNKYTFNDVFEGNGHELSGILLNKEYLYNGVFGQVGKTGVIRNLSVKDITYSFIGEKRAGYKGILCGKNQGLISNCHTRSCTIKKTNKDQEIGGLNGVNVGTIINSSTEKLTVDATNASVGGIAHSNSGKILNSYAASCQYPDKPDAGGICKRLYDNGIVANCYMYGKAQSNVSGIACIVEKTNKISHCYYPEGCNNGNNIPEGVKENVKTYNATTAYKLPDTLNAWIAKQGKEEYPDIPFTPWEEGEEIPAMFVTLSEN